MLAGKTLDQVSTLYGEVLSGFELIIESRSEKLTTARTTENRLGIEVT